LRSRSFVLSGEQIGAARAIARLGQAELARLSGLSLETIKRLEGIRGPVDANVRTIAAIIDAFNRKSVALELDEDGHVGVCLASALVPPTLTVDEVRSQGPEADPAVYRLIYFSRATAAALAAMEASVDAIRKVSARRNAELGVTGMLMVQDGWFLGALEGVKAAVQQVFGAISTDPRNSAPEVLQSRFVAQRQFSDWKVCCGLFASDEEAFAQEPSISGGFHPASLSPASALGLLALAHDQKAESPRRGQMTWNPCPLADQCLDNACVASARRLA
jgi:transcriptional regulator with XRE-family HTH domain